MNTTDIASHEIDPKNNQQYHFTYSRQQLKKNLWVITLGALVNSLLLYFLPSDIWNKTSIILFFASTTWPICLLALFTFYYSRLNITVDSTGIRTSGFLFHQMPTKSTWDEFIEIFETSRMNLGLNKASKDNTLIFTQEYGRQFVLSTPSLFIGVGHTLALIEAIETFRHIDEDNQDKAVPLALGKETGHVAAIAVISILITFFLIARSPKVIALDNWLHSIIYCIVFVLAFSLSSWYMRNIKNRPGMFMSAVILSAMATFVMSPLSELAPIWFGTKKQELFVIVEDTPQSQKWQTLTKPEHSFTLMVPSDRRVYNVVNSKLSLTVYHGPLGLSSIIAGNQLFIQRENKQPR